VLFAKLPYWAGMPSALLAGKLGAADAARIDA
jgi:hypothetical protein